MTRQITSFTRDGETWRRTREVHRLLLRPAADVERDLRDVGFRVRRMRAYGDQPMLPGRVAFRARRP